MPSPLRPWPRGVTLVELIIAAGLIGLLAKTATYFWVDGLGLARTVNADTAAIADGRALLERLAREIREVKFNTSAGAYCVSTMTATQMVFNKGVGGYINTCGGAAAGNSPATNDIAVSVRLANNQALTLGYAGALATPAATQALSNQATAFALRYLDANFAVTASASTLRFVELSVTLQPAGVQPTVSRTLVALRNY